jgi:hypothetical protein
VSHARKIAEEGRSDIVDAGHGGQLSNETRLSCPGKRASTAELMCRRKAYKRTI